MRFLDVSSNVGLAGATMLGARDVRGGAGSSAPIR